VTARIGGDDAGLRDRGAEEFRLLTRLVVADRIAEGLGAVPGGFWRAAADAELESAVGEQIGCRGGLGHVERVLVAHVDDAVPISIRLVLTPIAARSGKGEESWRAKWWTRTNAPSIPISSAATASSTVW